MGSLVVVPTRPSQTSPERAAAWEHHRRRSVSYPVHPGGPRSHPRRAGADFGVTRNLLIDVEHGWRGLLYERLYDIAKASAPVSELLVEDAK